MRRRVGQRARDPRSGEPGCEIRREPEDEQERRPLREHDVLQEVRPDEVRPRERVERRDQRHDEESATRENEADALPRARPGDDGVPDRERERDERLRAPRPCAGGHGATLRRTRV